ncbi:upstream activation factor subunit spp27 [Cryptomeria japonica]|uniref:upstream activation factor subunit spp27 n=1 Tax=Cryptomeria japonica TaxID=3369 RepID=UPI0027DA4695|nr:upstream activation factor subunit spp27 [Cryptomeria japonica]
MVSEELVSMLQNDPQLGVDVSEGSGQMEGKAQEGESRDLKENRTEDPASTPVEGRKRSRPGGLNKVCGVSPELQAIVGQPTMPRTQIVKQLWMYIRANNLQDPNNKRNIICNDALRLVFDTNSTDMFQMNKLLARHIWAIDSVDDDLEPNAKKIANVNAAPLISPAPISDSLASFLGTSEIEKPQEEVVKHLWNYITENNLQDMLDKEKVNCDEKLEKLFDCENFLESEMIKLLAPHFSRG